MLIRSKGATTHNESYFSQQSLVIILINVKLHIYYSLLLFIVMV